MSDSKKVTYLCVYISNNDVKVLREFTDSKQACNFMMTINCRMNDLNKTNYNDWYQNPHLVMQQIIE